MKKLILLTLLLSFPLRAEVEGGIGGAEQIVVGPDKPRPQPVASRSVKVRDLAAVSGVNANSLTGYGLVAGLPGTGDSSSALSSPMVTNLLQNLGLTVPTGKAANNKNLAVVAVTADLPAVCSSGDPIPVRVSSLGDAKSLEGGTLLLSILKGADGKVYASAQGPVASVAPTSKGSGNAAVAGIVPNGGIVATTMEASALKRNKLTWRLFNPDYGTAARMAQALTGRGWPAVATGPGTVEVWMVTQDPVTALAEMGEVSLDSGASARVVCDARTGTVVAGSDVRLLPGVVSHRGVTVEIGPQGGSLRGLVESLRQGGASPEDIVAVIQALSEAGSLRGEVVVR